MKGNNSSGNSRGRQYAIMLILAFGAAILGVMVLHKLRERRIFSILVKEKDHQLISLHLLLQKERDHNKEAKTKLQEMKAKMYSISTQKMELDSRVLELQSTISSLKEEQKTLETALEEKHNEIKFLRGKETDLDIENPQLSTLRKALKQRESEIEELKLRLGTNDPPYLAQNSTNRSQNQVQRDNIENEESGEKIEAKTKKVEKENHRLQGKDEGQNTEISSEEAGKLEMQGRESSHASEINERRSRFRVKQQRRVGEKYNTRFRLYGKQNGKYKRIVDDVLQNRLMPRGEVKTNSNLHGLVKEAQKNNATAVDENNNKIGKLELSTEKNVNGMQVRLETNHDERINRVHLTRKNEANTREMKEAVEDHKESKAEKVQEREGNGEGNEEPESQDLY